MIEQIEEIGAETQALVFTQVKSLVEGEIHIFLRRTNDAVARRVAVNRSVARASVGKRGSERVGCVRGCVDPVREARLLAAGGQGIRATGARGKGCGRRRSAGQGIG